MVVYSLDNTLINATHYSLSQSLCALRRPSRFVAHTNNVRAVSFRPYKRDMLAVSQPTHIRSFTRTKLLSDVNLGHERSLACIPKYISRVRWCFCFGVAVSRKLIVGLNFKFNFLMRTIFLSFTFS